MKKKMGQKTETLTDDERAVLASEGHFRDVSWTGGCQIEEIINKYNGQDLLLAEVLEAIPLAVCYEARLSRRNNSDVNYLELLLIFLSKQYSATPFLAKKLVQRLSQLTKEALKDREVGADADRFAEQLLRGAKSHIDEVFKGTEREEVYTEMVDTVLPSYAECRVNTYVKGCVNLLEDCSDMPKAFERVTVAISDRLFSMTNGGGLIGINVQRVEDLATIMLSPNNSEKGRRYAIAAWSTLLPQLVGSLHMDLIGDVLDRGCFDPRTTKMVVNARTVALSRQWALASQDMAKNVKAIAAVNVANARQASGVDKIQNNHDIVYKYLGAVAHRRLRQSCARLRKTNAKENG